MLNNTIEEDFQELKWISEDRLRPERIIIGLWGMFGFSGAMTAVTAFAVDYSIYITHPIWPYVVNISLVLLAIQLLVTIFFTNLHRIYKFQRFQSLALSILTLKMSVEMYPIFFLLCEDRNASAGIRISGIVIILTGIAILIFSTIRGIGRVKQGEFKQGGRLLYNFQKRQGSVNISLIAGGVVLGGILARFAPELFGIHEDIVTISICLFLSIWVQYSVSLVWPEFFLLTYCKFRFNSFILEMPPHIEKKKRISMRESFVYWRNKPLSAIKSRAGWNMPHKAPFWILCLVTVEMSVLIFVSLFLLTLIAEENRANLADEPYTYLMPFIMVSLFLALVIIVCTWIVLKMLNKLRGRGVNR